MKMSSPLISVVTVVYNDVANIEATMLSVLNQSYSHVEYIIIDGGSTDGTVDVIRRYADRLAYWHTERDGGIYFGMNSGIAHTSGDWINFMNAGDCFVNHQVLEQFFALPVAQDIAVLYGDTLNLKGKEIFFWPNRELGSIVNQSLPFCHQASFVRGEILRQQPFDTRFRLIADYAMFRQLYLSGAKFEFREIKVALYDLTGASNFATNAKRILEEKYRAQKRNKDLLYYYCSFEITLLSRLPFLSDCRDNAKKMIKYLLKIKSNKFGELS